MEQKQTWVTTIDNPFDPFEESENWKRFDEEKGYFTSNIIARIANVNDEMSDDTYDFMIEQAVDEIVRFNTLGIYKKAVKGEENVSSEENRKKARNFIESQIAKS